MYQSGTGMQEVIQMCSSFDSNKSTKGASKLRRDLINGEIANLRDLLPLPSSTRQRLSQLQLMALVCVYVRKANYFQQVFKRFHELGHPYSTPNIGFSKALSGFLIMMTQNGKLLYISDNAAEYLGHSMEDLLIHGDSVYDIIDKADHGTVQAELLRSSNLQNPPGEETRVFLCRMNVSRNARRQMRFGDQKVVLLQGHFLSYLPLCSRNEPVFVATCTPVAMPETRECVVQGATNVFTTIHAMDMKFMHIDRNGEYYLGYTRSELGGISWYQLIHWNYMREAQSKHRLISQSEQEKSCILLLRLQTRSGDWLWIHCVLQVKDGSESASNSSSTTSSAAQQQSVIVATNQVLSEREAAVMRANAWLYHYYTVQTKLQYGLAYPEGAGTGVVGTASPQQAAAAARLVAAAAYFPAQQLMNYGTHQTQPHPHHHLHHPHHPQAIAHLHQVSPETSSSGGYGSPPTPHNGTYPSGNHTNPYHYHHSFEMASGGGTKESPLDFSLAASPMFEFHMGASAGGYSTSPGASYWTHHHHHHHGGGGSVGYNSRLSDGSPSSTVSLSATSPQTWSTPSSILHQGSQHQHQLSSSSTPSTSISNLSPSSTSAGGPTPRKRSKRNTEAIIEPSASPPLSSNSHSTPRRHSAIGFSSGDTAVATMPSIFPYHARPRSLYKMLGSEDETMASVSAIKEENMTIMACPLTPSPIWEGQTQRVPDLQQFYGDRTDSGAGMMPGTDLIHCVPTYQPYLPFCPPSTSMSGVGQGYGLAGLSFNGFGGTGGSSSGNGLTTSSMMLMETGSPNKENRLPPTPDSDHGENEENRPLKWETL